MGTRVFHDKLFDEDRMYEYIRRYAAGESATGGPADREQAGDIRLPLRPGKPVLRQTLAALLYAGKKHFGQLRRGSDRVPYIEHPLNMACHAIAEGVTDDDLLAGCLLHDVCEDCGVKPEELPFDETVRGYVDALTFEIREGETRSSAKARYYSTLAENPGAALIKLFDRCNNVSFMSYCFPRSHMKEYITETRNYVLPLGDVVERELPQYAGAVFALRYHIGSVIGTVEALTGTEV